MRKISGLMGLAFLFLAVSCAQKTEEIVAEVGDEKVYPSDLTLYKKDVKLLKTTKDYGERLVGLLHDIAFVKLGEREFPGVRTEGKNYLARMETRALSSVYQRFYALERLFHTDEELKTFYKSNLERYQTEDSLSFEEMKEKIAEDLYVKENEEAFEAFLAQAVKNISSPEKIELSYFETKDSSLASAMFYRIQSGENPDSVGGFSKALLSQEELNEENVKSEYATLKKALSLPSFREELFGDSIFPRSGLSSFLDSSKATFIVYRVLNKIPAVRGEKEALRASSQKKFIDEVKREIVQTTGPKLVKKYALEVVSPKPDDLKKYYDKDPSRWKTERGLFLYHIQKSDSLALEALAQKISSKESFLKEVSQSENKKTAKRKGEMGLVRKGHSLPYGVGLLPELFENFPEGATGLSKVLKANGAFHLFYVEKSEAPKEKSYERAKSEIEQGLLSGALPQDSMTPLVLEAGKPVLFERDFLSVRNELPEERRLRFTRKQIASYLMEWYAFAKEARAVGLDKEAEYGALSRSLRRNFEKKLIADSIEKRPASKQQIEETYEKYKSAFSEEPKEAIDEKIAVLAQVTPNEIRHELFLNGYDDSTKMVEGISKIISELQKQIKTKKTLRFGHRAEVEFPLRHVNPVFQTARYGNDAEKAIVYAENFSQSQQLEKALFEWSFVRIYFADDDEIFARATIEMAKILTEQQNYDEANKEYRAFLGMFPHHAENEKALFARAFLLDENLSQKKEALTLYNDFLQKYPQSELRESVEWLAKNIESDGALETELVKKIESTADSL